MGGGETLKEVPKVDPGQEAVEAILGAENIDIDKNLNIEKAKEEIYNQNKETLIQHITTWKMNSKYNTVDKNNIEYKNTTFLNENDQSVRSYILYYNISQIDAKYKNKDNTMYYDQPYNQIDIEDFMVRFQKEKEKNKPEPHDTEMFNPKEQFQKIGEFPIDKQHIQNISSQVTAMMEVEQPVLNIDIIGKADATSITLKGKAEVIKSFKEYRKTLVDKGRTKWGNVPQTNFLDNLSDDELKTPEQQNKLNEGFARTRAFMQLAYLQSDQLAYLQKSKNINLAVDHQEVGSGKIGDMFTGGGIEMETYAGSTIIETIETALNLLQNRTINYALEFSNGEYSTLASIHFENINGEKEIYRDVSDKENKDIIINRKFIPNAQKKKTFLDQNKKVNTLWIPITTALTGKNERKDLEETKDWVNTNVPQNTVDGYIKALEDAKKNTTDEGVQAYIDETKDIMEIYKQAQYTEKTKITEKGAIDKL